MSGEKPKTNDLSHDCPDKVKIRRPKAITEIESACKLPIAPTVHLGGTSKEALLEQNSEARHAISAAIKALQEATPHARDYFQENTYLLARVEHGSRLDKLALVLAQLNSIANQIADQ